MRGVDALPAAVSTAELAAQLTVDHSRSVRLADVAVQPNVRVHEAGLKVHTPRVDPDGLTTERLLGN